MGKITEALKKADEDRLKQREQPRLSAEAYSREGQKMKNSGLVWLFIIGFVVTIFVSFNFQRGKEATPLAEIFPDEEVIPVDVEYEFVESDVHKEDMQDIQKVESKIGPQKVVVIKKAPVEKKKAPKIVKSSVPEKYSFTIQVASFKIKNKAKKILDELNKKGYPSAYIASKDLGSKGIWYRVYIGHFDNKRQAAKLLEKVKQKYKGSFIIKR